MQDELNPYQSPIPPATPALRRQRSSRRYREFLVGMPCEGRRFRTAIGSPRFALICFKKLSAGLAALLAAVVLQACSGYYYGKLILPIPYDKSYDQLSADQKKIVRSWYLNLPDDIEPPFPANGLADVLKAAHINTVPVSTKPGGPVTIVVQVDSTGAVSNVTWKGGAQYFIATNLSNAFAGVRFKPATRNGVPIPYVFYFSVDVM